MKAPFLLFLAVYSPAFAQTQPTPAMQSAPTTQPTSAPQPPSYANYSIMLVSPTSGAVVLMHSPQNQLEFVPVNDTKQAMSAGYVPVRAAELGEFIAALKEENAELVAENARLQNRAAMPAPQPTSSAEEKELRRQRMIQGWLMLQGIGRPQTMNLNVTNCNQNPALCAGR